jgi:hypothetical protein
MSEPGFKSIIPSERIESLICFLRGQKVILDSDLASLYQVETGALVRAVKRNMERFPEDFMFQLSNEEFKHLRSQFGTSSSWGGRRYAPYAFTEHGVAMLSGILKSKRAIQVNIEIVRAFVRLRKILSEHQDLSRKIMNLEKQYDAQFRVVFDALKQMMKPASNSEKHIGFKTGKDKH